MTFNLKQNNKEGDNNASFSNSGNDIKISNKIILKYQTQGFITGVIASIIASLILKIFFMFRKQ